MEAVFIKLINMSITASWLVLAVVLVRLVFNRTPKSIICVLWALVAVRLIFPVSIESALSLVPNVNTISEDIISSETNKMNTEVNENLANSTNTIILDKAQNGEMLNGVQRDNIGENTLDEVNIVETIVLVISKLWIIGIIVMILYAVISYGRLAMKIRESIVYKDNIYVCDRVSSPFILGVIHPRIILPSNMKENDMIYVIAHEQAHIKRLDYLWKPLGFTLLTIYWFNPVIWIAYVLLCRDIEMACDEKVIKEMDIIDKKQYTVTLLEYSISGKMVTACPLAFGEGSIKNRIKHVLSYKKPAFWVIIMAAIICISVAVTFLTNPKGKETAENTEDIDTYGYYEYPDIKSMEYDEKVDACRIEQEILDKMSTEELAQAVVDWPLLTNIGLSSYYVEYEELYEKCDAFAELMSRNDAKEIFTAKVEEVKKTSKDDDIKVLILQDIIYREFKSFKFGTSSTVVRYTESDKFLSNALNNEILWMSSSLSYPVHRMDSVEQLENFVDDYRDIFVFDSRYDSNASSFIENTSEYDDEYFEENTLFLVYVGTSVMNNAFYASNVRINDDKLEIVISSEQDRYTGDTAMSGYLIAVELSKEVVSGCNVFNAVYEY